MLAKVIITGITTGIATEVNNGSITGIAPVEMYATIRSLFFYFTASIDRAVA
jgi:hypothetical protein